MELTDNAVPLTVDSNARVTESLKDCCEWLVGESPGLDAEDLARILCVSDIHAIQVTDELFSEGRIEFCEDK